MAVYSLRSQSGFFLRRLIMRSVQRFFSTTATIVPAEPRAVDIEAKRYLSFRRRLQCSSLRLHAPANGTRSGACSGYK
jgi:hypothetical protein